MAMEMADYTFKMTKFTSHIVFIGRCLRKRLIPKGFRLKFHPADGDRRNKRFSKITDSCSRRLMQATVQKLKFQLNIISTQKCRAYRRFQSNSTPAEYHRATILISEINSRAHRMIKEAKGAKFATLLKEETSKSSATYCDASLGKRTVVTIPEDLPLNNAEHSVLSKGLTFVPTVNKTDEYQVKADCKKFFRRLCLKAHFHDSEDEHHEDDNHHDPFTKFDNKTSTWTPPDGKFSALDHYIDRCRRSIASRNYTRRPNFSNLSQEEKNGITRLKTAQ